MKNKITEQSIFIHIPKTGGTTINCVMNNSKWQTMPDFNYRHINHDTKRSNSKDIFNPINYDKYSDYKIFMLLRHPVDRLISEYYFIKDRSEFMSLIKPSPNNLKQYIKSKQTQNYMIGFLLGKRMYDTNYVNRTDFELVKNSIRNLPIYTGIFEKYQESMTYFENKTGIKWPKKVEVKRITLNRPEIDDISDEIRDLILKNNQLDYELYEHCLKIFNENTQNLSVNNILFKKNKYDYVLKYTERFCLLELNLKTKDFILAHSEFFEDLSFHLHTKVGAKKGKSYVELWNAAFIKAVKEQLPNTMLSADIDMAINDKDDPLNQTKAISNIIDIVLKKDKKNQKRYLNKLSFSDKLVKKPSFFQLFS